MKNTLESLQHAAIDNDKLTQVNGGDLNFFGVVIPFPTVQAAQGSSASVGLNLPGFTGSWTGGSFFGFKI